MDSLKNVFSGTGLVEEEEEELPQWMKEIDESISLTWEQRFWGFGICFTIGCVLGIASIITIFNATLFATLYTFANIFYLGSTFFLVGPMKQVRNMKEESRMIASIVYLISMVMTLVVALVWELALLALVFVIIQSAALFWYTLTYIPGGRAALKSCAQMLLPN